MDNGNAQMDISSHFSIFAKWTFHEVARLVDFTILNSIGVINMQNIVAVFINVIHTSRERMIMIKYWDEITCHSWTDKELIKKFRKMIRCLKKTPEEFSIRMSVTLMEMEGDENDL